MNNSISYKELIEKNGMYICTPIGTSMMPMLRERIDTVKLVKPEGRLKKYDVILYQRKCGTYVLHRIVKVKKNCYYLCGDNQCVIEKNVTDDMIIGVMEGYYREEIYITKENVEYVKYYRKKVRSIPFRYCINLFKRILNKMKRILKNKN